MSLHTTLIAIAQDIWHVQKPLKTMGISGSSRMTVVRLPNGDLWLHSPVRLDDALNAALDTLGTVRYVVSPNLVHHLFVADYLAAYPAAKLYANPSLVKKRPDLAAQIEPLTHTLPSSWQGALQQQSLEGVPALQEWVWLHQPSNTLILTDAVQWMQSPLRSIALYASLMGVRLAPAVSRLVKAAIKDKAAFAQSWRQILAWDFERVILNHDVILERTDTLDVKAQLRVALANYI